MLSDIDASALAGSNLGRGARAHLRPGVRWHCRTELERLRELFQRYLPPGDTRTFDAESAFVQERGSGSYYAQGCVTQGPPTIRATYEGGGFSILYYRRYAAHLGDTDVFVDELVVVDGVTVHKREWE